MAAKVEIRTLWITRKSGNYFPELIAAWDEFSIDGNEFGFLAACEEALASLRDDLAEVRYVTLRLDAKAITQLFVSPTVDVEVIEGDA